MCDHCAGQPLLDDGLEAEEQDSVILFAPPRFEVRADLGGAGRIEPVVGQLVPVSQEDQVVHGERACGDDDGTTSGPD